MNLTWVHYEICMEDEHGLFYFGPHYLDRAEAETKLQTYRTSPDYRTAFIVAVVATRCGASRD